MKIKHLSLVALIGITFSACDQLGIDPTIEGTDCLNQDDRDNYANLIANEKMLSTKVEEFLFTPGNVPEEQRESFSAELTSLNDLHDGYRKNFKCQYWGEDNDFLALLSSDGSEIDEDFLDPELYKAKFRITSEAVFNAISQAEWFGKNVYVFPGISRIPWEGASETSKQEALKRINGAYNKIRKEHGFTDEIELFDSEFDYIFPHATFHQVYISYFANAVKAPSNTEVQELIIEMNKIEENVIEKFIKRAPDTI